MGQDSLGDNASLIEGRHGHQHQKLFTAPACGMSVVRTQRAVYVVMQLQAKH
jgi:hypothetical protein